MRELEKERAYAESLIENAPDPVFVSDLEGKILQANDAVSELLGFRKDEVLEQSLSRFISPEETQEFTAALREVVEHGVTRDAVLNPRSASGEIIPPKRAPQPPQRLGRDHPDDAERVRAPRLRRESNWRDRHPP